MNLDAIILKIAGWRVNITVPDYPKCIICVAPHTSNWDFILGLLAYSAVGRRAGFLMKEAWFFWPLGCLFRAIGGIAVPKEKGSRLSDEIVRRFDSTDRMQLAITPEGTRKRVTHWRTGFLHIAAEAHVPILLGAIDFATKQIIIEEEFKPTGDIYADMRAIKDYYSPFVGRYPDKFTTDD